MVVVDLVSGKMVRQRLMTVPHSLSVGWSTMKMNAERTVVMPGDMVVVYMIAVAVILLPVDPLVVIEMRELSVMPVRSSSTLPLGVSGMITVVTNLLIHRD